MADDLRRLASGGLEHGRGRRRRTRLAVGGAATLLLAGGITGGILLAREDGRRESTSEARPGEQTTQSSTTTTTTQPASLAPIVINPPLPTGWIQIDGPLYPDISPPEARVPPAETTAATFDVPAEPSRECDYPIAALERLGPDDAFVSVVEARGTGDPSPRPPTPNFLPPDVPINLVPEGERDLTTELCLARQPDFRFNETSFAENGRIVRVFVGIGLEATPETEAQVLDVVNRIVVEPPTNVG